MKKLFLVGAIILAAAASKAAPAYNYSSGGSSTVTGILGFSSGAVNFGANYEHRMDNTMGVGGFFHYSTEKKDDSRPSFTNYQTVSFGAMAPAHFLDDNRFDLYLAPGVGISMVKGIDRAGYAIQDDQTMFGPVWKAGALFKITPTVRIGLEHFEIVNWFTDKLPANTQYTNAAFAFNF